MGFGNLRMVNPRELHLHHPSFHCVARLGHSLVLGLANGDTSRRKEVDDRWAGKLHGLPPQGYGS
ncbi:unnamed protein product [Clonostachys rhizophaga]|uniref:Uncharacterized protein n=1 Tax=Clonostachys rhizophaga TaxID=160324 RepID=A0A9N9YJJ7_9HYPO|nr:unnamed protein product [Clonostachys rhizophaga]